MTRMWIVKLCHQEAGYLCDLECSADTLLDAAIIFTRSLKEGEYLTDLCTRGTIA